MRAAPAELEEPLRAPLGNPVVLTAGHRGDQLRASRALILDGG